MSMTIMKKAIFLDRDGTINVDIGYEFSTDKCKILPGVIEGLKLLEKDYVFFIVTNQSGIGLGYYPHETFVEFNRYVLEKLGAQGITVLKTYCCPHAKENNCDCRKPKTKFVLEAREEFNVNLKNSWVIGDHPSDVLLGINAGCRTVYLLTGHGASHLDDIKEKNIKVTVIAENFLTAAKEILKIDNDE
jgi:D-glycero-D-manno-heptose 1,7-bisphosphate phosphatase